MSVGANSYLWKSFHLSAAASCCRAANRVHSPFCRFSLMGVGSTTLATSVCGRAELMSLTRAKTTDEWWWTNIVLGRASQLLTRWLPLNVGLTVGQLIGREVGNPSSLLDWSGHIATACPIFLSVVTVSMLPMQLLLKSLRYACWCVINSKSMEQPVLLLTTPDGEGGLGDTRTPVFDVSVLTNLTDNNITPYTLL